MGLGVGVGYIGGECVVGRCVGVGGVGRWVFSDESQVVMCSGM